MERPRKDKRKQNKIICNNTDKQNRIKKDRIKLAKRHPWHALHACVSPPESPHGRARRCWGFRLLRILPLAPPSSNLRQFTACSRCQNRHPTIPGAFSTFWRVYSHMYCQRDVNVQKDPYATPHVELVCASGTALLLALLPSSAFVCFCERA